MGGKLPSKDEVLEYYSLVNPYFVGKFRAFTEAGIPLVKYATLDTALKIIGSREIWFRNARNMNDYREIEHGQSLLFGSLETATGTAFANAINKVTDGKWDTIVESLRSNAGTFHQDTYITCLSEHLPNENDLGRLSMWRAYGDIAFVIDPSFMYDQPNTPLYTSPVMYADAETFGAYIGDIANSISDNANILGGTGGFIHYLLEMLFSSLQLCTKHPGFSEEREWRVLYNPTDYIFDHMLETNVATGSSNETFYRLPLSDPGIDGVHGWDLNQLLKRVIIGPTADKVRARSALVGALKEAGIQEPDDMILVSGIPYRA